MDLPAPVSPVRILNDCSKSTATDSITARLRMARNRIMRNHSRTRNCHRIIALTVFPVACYGCLNRALSQQRTPHGLDSEGLLPTPGLFVLAVQLEGERALTRAAAGDFTDLIFSASPVVKFVMALLLIFSVISWGIILYKWWAYRGIEKQTATFLEVFRKSAKFSEVQAVCPSLSLSPLTGMFQAGYAELTAQLRLSQQPAASPGTPAPRPTLKSLTAVDRALLRASSIEVNKLERRVGFLATTASITPFIGLF